MGCLWIADQTDDESANKEEVIEVDKRAEKEESQEEGEVG